MPEAAEVSVAAAQLAHVAVGRELTSLTVTHPRTVRHLATPDALDPLRGPVTAVERHGKWLAVRLHHRSQRLGVHLRMSGRLIVAEPGSPPPRHVHAVLRFAHRSGHALAVSGAPPPPSAALGTADDPVDVWFFDPRTFGELRVLPADDAPVAEDLFDGSIDADALAARTVRRRVGVKAVLLDQQRFVAGIGSYLADEILHRAGISPRQPASSLDTTAWQRVLDHARALTESSAAVGGVTLPDEGWLDLWERPGRFGEQLAVHGRDTCATCGAPTQRAVVGGRSARWCPVCQPPR